MASLKKKLWLGIIRKKPSDWLKMVWIVLPLALFVSLILMAVSDFTSSLEKYDSIYIFGIRAIELFSIVTVFLTQGLHKMFWPLFRPIYNWMVEREGRL